MAMGGTLEGGHEPFYDFPCSLCEEEDRHVEAAKYCEECLVYLCGHCLRDKHNKFPLNKRHTLLDQSKFSTVSKSTIASFPTKRCPKHPGELIDIFCGNHDVVCCKICKALEHGSCSQTQHLPDAATGVKERKEYQSIKTRTTALLSDLEKVYNDREADISRITKERQHVTQTIADFRKKINTYFDDLEKNALAELDHKEKTILCSIDQDKKYLETTKSNAEDILEKIESFKGDNECDLFVQVKTGLQFLNNAEKKHRDMCQADVKPSIHFEISKSIGDYIASLKSLGSFSSTRVDTTQPQTSVVPKVTSPSPLVLPTGSQPDHEFYGKFNVKERSDTYTCNIYSVCQMPDDSFLITDWNNEKLKRLDQSLKLLDSVQFSDCAHSVCANGPNQAVVSMCWDEKIEFVSVGKRLTQTGLFTVGSYCRGVVYCRNELYICCGDSRDSSSYCIEVYNNAGHLQRTIPRAPLRLSSMPNYITATDDGQHLLVSSYDSDDITMLDLIGNVVNTFSHRDLKGPTGICTDGRGHAFVCGFDSNTVVQLSPQHQKIEVILTHADGIKKPQGVCYDKGQSRLLVSCEKSNELLVFI